eukprot:CAMPEP_0197449198 /NCGR_PEP_ID=MMETSP1175-20131217/20345_1 /TAXON_ID=1003142 /ORGANISM="Triceratium dubium, Strain CCMP147" /LENGTH=895 /DNA_ID=CAMNT_0042981233 /DNA_START=206 /DNA_END=2894 /DNA_ORIENTATION=+
MQGPTPVSGHGHLISPRSRNYVAFKDGKYWYPADDPSKSTTPWIENCPNCLNKGGVCGTSSSSYSGGYINYNDPPNALGESMPTNIQATYTEGEVIELETVLTAHHKGYFQYKVCRLDELNQPGPTQECFDANPLTFEEDMVYGAPKDPDNPGRAYISPNGMEFRHRFKLPTGLHGDKVLLQWHYVTGNSCEDKDYGNNPWKEGLSTCSQPLPLQGIPEQFWNCAEIKIIPAGGPSAPTEPSGPTGVPAPTPPLPTVPLPTAPLPTAPLPTAPLPTAPLPTAPSPTAPSPTALLPTQPVASPSQHPGTPTTSNMCGLSWADASSRCGTPCPTGNATVCPFGEYCYADVNVKACGGGGGDTSPTSSPIVAPTPAIVTGNTNFCGVSWFDANSRCQKPCPSGDPEVCFAPGETCFANCNACVESNPSGPSAPTPAMAANYNYCGTSWADANGKCSQACPGGVDSECLPGEYCFGDCTACTGTPEGPSGPAPTPATMPTPVEPTSLRPTNSPFPVGMCDPLQRMKVNVGYYQSWATYRNGCFNPEPADLDISGMQYTHLIYSFASVSASNTLEPYFSDYNREVSMYNKFKALKTTHPSLKTLIAVGGWTHNEPGKDTCHRFATVSSSPENRQTFANSVVSFLVQYGFDGIDLDWEYPADADRCGTSDDKTNYALLVEAIRTAFDDGGHDFLITMAIPVSEFRLGEGYDLLSLSQNLDWFNIMTYDIAGTWSSAVGSHTDMQYIENTISYILGEGVPSYQLAMGLGAYGRTFTLSDPNCVDIGCDFNSAASGGCGGEVGFTPYFNIANTIDSGVYKKLELNHQTGSMEMVTTNNEFVSFDNKETFQIKYDYADAMCMRGCFWWAADMIVEGFTLEANNATSTKLEASGETDDVLGACLE